MGAREILERKLRQEQQPSPVQKYEEQQAVHWNLLMELQDLCASFDAERRLRSVEGIIKIVKEDKAVVGCEVVNLAVSQFTSIEKYNEKLTVKLVSQAEDSSVILGASEPSQIPENDGTNACTFLCLKICDEILVQSNVLENDSDWYKKIEVLATDVIKNYPISLNQFRTKELCYTTLDAKSLMEAHEQLKNQIELSEELLGADNVYSKNGRRNLILRLSELASKSESALAIFTSEPYTLMIGCMAKSLFCLDTHHVPPSCGGNLNGQLRVYENTEATAIQSMCKWLWTRLSEAGVQNGTGQSLSVVTSRNRQSTDGDKMVSSVENVSCAKEANHPVDCSQVR